MGEGKYEERLDCGGTLEVTRSSWQIRYYFPGPDLRHKGEFVSLPGSSICDYIQALKDNWVEFEKLKQTIPAGGDFSKSGAMGMTIRVSRFAQGVCIRSYHMPLATRSQLDKVIGAYGYAAQRAPKVQQLLSSL